MKRPAFVLLFVLSTAALAAQAGEPVDLAAIAKIREQGLKQSKVMDHLFQMTDVHGPRLQGSPGIESAGDWVVATLKSWGLQNARKERWPYGTGWSLNAFHATMTAPQTMPIIGLPKAWSTGTKGMVSADVVRPQITNAEDAAKWKGQLRGKIVLTQPAREVRMLEGRIVLRMNDKDIEEALSVPAPRGGGAGAAGAAGGRGAGAGGGRAGGAAGGGTPAFNVNQFYADEGVVALFDRGSNSDMSAGGSDLSWQTQRTDGGTVFVGGATGGGRNSANNGVPQVTLAVEHYNRMVRLLDAKVPVKVDLNIDVKFHPETPERLNGFNIIADLPGTDLANEIVLIGGHFDSWHGATGATDNATGCSAMMEVLRIIKDAGLKPRRTIRIALWGGEEQGLLGSRAYADQYLGTPDAPKPGQAQHSAYFNLDNGTGKVRGIWMQSNPNVAPVFKAWIAPLKDLGVEILGPRSVASTDHTNIDRTGVPGFQFVQERLEYNSRTHHSNMDFYDRVQVEDLKQTATVAAVFAYQTAMRDQKLPRK
jgi:carboxypeptidase Q